MINNISLIKSELWKNCNVNLNPVIKQTWYSDNKVISLCEIFNLGISIDSIDNFNFLNALNVSTYFNKILSFVFKDTNFNYKMAINQKRLKFIKNYSQAQKLNYLENIYIDKLFILKNFFNTLEKKKKNKNTLKIEISLLDKISTCENTIVKIQNQKSLLLKKLRKYCPNLSISNNIYTINNIEVLIKSNRVYKYLNQYYSKVYKNRVVQASILPLQSCIVWPNDRRGILNANIGSFQEIYFQNIKSQLKDTKRKFTLSVQHSMNSEQLIQEKISIIKNSLIENLNGMKQIYKINVDTSDILSIKNFLLKCINSPETLQFDLVNHIEETYSLFEELISSYFQLNHLLISISEISNIEPLKLLKLNETDIYKLKF